MRLLFCILLLFQYICAIGGVVNYLGRIAYAQGYYTGGQLKRESSIQI